MRPPAGSARPVPLTLGLLAAALLVLSACMATARRQGDYFVSKKNGWRVAAPGAGWDRVKIDDIDLAFFHEGRRATIILARSCKPRLRTEPPALARQLTIGLNGKEVLFDGDVELPAGRARRLDVRGSLDGSPIGISAFVLRRERCVFDLACFGRPEALKAAAPEFEAFARSLRFDGREEAG